MAIPSIDNLVLCLVVDDGLLCGRNLISQFYEASLKPLTSFPSYLIRCLDLTREISFNDRVRHLGSALGIHRFEINIDQISTALHDSETLVENSDGVSRAPILRFRPAAFD